ncbi:MAG: hypothetical protein V1837_06785 [Candidatus Woesearchaeota archaeon]
MTIEYFTYKPKDIETEKWLKREKEDSENFAREVGVSIDKMGIVGEDLFSLTLDNQSATLGYRSVSVVTGETTAKGMLNALCPELECFVTLVNWMGTSDHRKSNRVTYHHELDNFVSTGNPNQVCILSGNYRLKNDEFSTITLFRANAKITTKTKRFYDWERVPFLKRTGETFAYYPSPIFMLPVKSREENVSEDKVYYFTAPFMIIKLSATLLKIAVINATNPNQTITEVCVYDGNLTNLVSSKLGSLYTGLFEDKIYRRKGQFEREIVLLNMSQEELDGNDLVGHLITQRMYYHYLKTRLLRICSDYEFEETLKTIISQTERVYGVKVTMKLEFFEKTYLDAYFKKIDGAWYYKPYILNELNDVQLIELIDQIQNKDGQELTVERLIMKEKYRKYQSYLEFLNCYNLYSKRILINMVAYKEGLTKWLI